MKERVREYTNIHPDRRTHKFLQSAPFFILLLHGKLESRKPPTSPPALSAWWFLGIMTGGRSGGRIATRN